MGSKAQRRKARKAANRAARDAATPNAPQLVATSPAKPTARPTRERLARGRWDVPQGQNKASQPMVDAASDMIGALYASKQLTPSQEQAARLFSELRAAYLAELGVASYVSCLATGGGGHDAGDGNPAAIKAYRDLERKIGQAYSNCLILEIEKLPHQRPLSLHALRAALDMVNRC